MRFVHTYRVYGLCLRANRTIPGLATAPEANARPGDVQVELTGPQLHQGLPDFRAILYTSPGRDERGEHFLKVCWIEGGDDGCLYLGYTNADAYAGFLVDEAGSRIRATWTEATPFEDVETFLLGPVLGCVLRLRGVTCLHASVIATTDSSAIVIVGPKGGGKSTLAAALAQRGYAVLSDDIAALAKDGETCLVHPGYPRMRLWPATVDILSDVTVDALPRVLSVEEKRYLDLSPRQSAARWRFQSEPLPLVAVYVLGAPSSAGIAPHITPVSAADGLIALMRNTYADYLLDRTGRSRDFDMLGWLSAAIPLRKVHRPLGLDALSQTRDAILEDVQGLVSVGC